MYSKGQGCGQERAHFRLYIGNSDRYCKNVLLPSNSKSIMAFRLTYLHLILTHSKVESQGRVYLSRKCLELGDNMVKLLLPSNSKSCMS